MPATATPAHVPAVDQPQHPLAAIDAELAARPGGSPGSPAA